MTKLRKFVPILSIRKGFSFLVAMYSIANLLFIAFVCWGIYRLVTYFTTP